MIHFDTNLLVEGVRLGSRAFLDYVPKTSDPEPINICTIALAEFLCGPLSSAEETLVREVFPDPEPFLSSDAALAAKLFNSIGRRSRSLADCMIAAVAIRCGASLATRNTSDFEAFVRHGLMLV